MAQLQELINKYEVYFLDCYALTYQVHGRLWRRKGYCKEALECDKRAMAKLAEKNINNLGVRITYASTVSIALENKDDSIQEEDICKSVEAIEEAIALNSKYAKYSYLKAKIMMFRLTFGVDNYDYSECAKQVSIAKELLRTAIEYEDEKSDSYMHHIIDYKSYMREADLILAEIRTLILIKKQSEQSVAASDAFKKTLQEVKNAEEKIYQTQNTLNERMLEIQSTLNERLYEVQNSVDEKLHQTQNHFLEILALFVSVVSIIMVAVGMLSKQFTILQTIFAIIIMNVCAVAVYSSFLMLLHDKLVTRHMVALVLCIIIVCVVIAFLFYLNPVCSL